MKHYYINEQISAIPRELFNHYPFNRKNLVQIRYIERFKGKRPNDILTNHPHWELTSIIDGDVAIKTQDRELWCKAGNIVLIPPGVWHKEFTKELVDLIWLGFEMEIKPEMAPTSPVQISSEDILGKIQLLWKMAINRIPESGLEMDALLMMILGEFFRLCNQNDSTYHYRLSKAIEFINSNPTAEFTIESLAELCNCSKSHFTRDFKKKLGVSPIQYILSLRLELARSYLRETELSAVQIAAMCGFHDPFYFSKMFKRRFGVPPIQFRAQSQNRLLI